MLSRKTVPSLLFIVMRLCFSGELFGSDSAISTTNISTANSGQKENRKLQFIDEDCDGINDIIQNREKYPNTFGGPHSPWGGQSGSGMFSDEGMAGKRGGRNASNRGAGRR